MKYFEPGIGQDKTPALGHNPLKLGKQINITLTHVYAQTMNAEETEAKQKLSSNVQHIVDTTPLKKASFHLLN